MEQLEPQHGIVVLARGDGQRIRVSVRFLISHPDCRPSSRSAAAAADRGRQPKTVQDLSPRQRELTYLRLAHLLEAETGFRSGDPSQPAPGEPRPEYDPAVTTLTQRRHAKSLLIKHIRLGEPGCNRHDLMTAACGRGQ